MIEMEDKKFKYWIVGASMKSGTNNVDEKFVKNGFWALGYSKDGNEQQYAKAQEIQVNDRIAIKRRCGQGSPNIKILHIGIVKGVIKEFSDQVICNVDWLVINKDIEVESKGCYKTVHGPYFKDGEHQQWIEEIFSL